jgi:hypothetical protein
LITSLPFLFEKEEEMADEIVEIIKNSLDPKSKFQIVTLKKLFRNSSEKILLELICYHFYEYLNQEFFRKNNKITRKAKIILESNEIHNGKNKAYIKEEIKKYLDFYL